MTLVQVAHQDYRLFIHSVWPDRASTVGILNPRYRHGGVTNGARTRHVFNANDFKIIGNHGTAFGVAEAFDNLNVARFDGSLDATTKGSSHS